MYKLFSDVKVGETVAFVNGRKAIKLFERDVRGYHYVMYADNSQLSEYGFSPMLQVMPDRKTKTLSDVKVGEVFVFDNNGIQAIKLAETDDLGNYYVWYVGTRNKSITGKHHSNPVKDQTESEPEDTTFGDLKCGESFKFTKNGLSAIKLAAKDYLGGNNNHHAFFTELGQRSISGVSPDMRVERTGLDIVYKVKFGLPDLK